MDRTPYAHRLRRQARTTRLALAAPLSIVLAIGSLAPAVAATPVAGSHFQPRPARLLRTVRSADDADDSYRYLAGLIDKKLFELAVKEGKAFLEAHPRHAKAALARYRLAGALFELERMDAAAEHYAQLAEARGFEYRAESAFRLGQCQLEQGALDAAALAFRNVLSLDQSYLHGPATFFQGETAFRRGETAEAEKSYERLIQRFQDSEYVPGARRGLAWCAWNATDAEATVQRARTYLRHHAEAATGDDSADEMRVLLGEALLETGDHKAALAAFREVRAAAFRDARRRGSGFALAAAGKHLAAAKEFALLLREHPDSRFAVEARLQLGLQTLRAGDAPTAVKALKLATKNTGKASAEAHYWLSQAESATDDHTAALGSLDRALAAKPNEELAARIEVARGDELHALGRTQDALAAYEKGGSDYALNAAAVASLNRADHVNAIRFAEQLLEQYATSDYRVQAMLVRAEALFAREEYAEARAGFDNVLTSSPTELQAAQAQQRIAWSLYKTGRGSQAVQEFERLVREHGEAEAAEEGLYMLGRLLLESEDEAGALLRGEQYLERYPDGAHRAEVLFACGRASGAERSTAFYRTLLREHGGSDLVPDTLLVLADAASAAGDTAGAVEYYTAILREHKEHPSTHEARYGLGWCFYNQENYRDSVRHLDHVGRDDAAPEDLRLAALELSVWASAKAGKAPAAAQTWRRLAGVLRDDARSFQSLRTVVAALRDGGRIAAAQELLQEFMGTVQSPEIGIEALIEGAYLSLEGGDLERADAEVQVAAKRSSNSVAVAEAAFFVGEARFAAGAEQRAVALYRTAASTDNPMRPNALYKLGFTLMAVEDLEGAGAAFRVVVDEYPEHELFGESLFLLGEALFRAEQLGEAIVVLEHLRKVAPRHEVLPKGLFRLGVALGRQERWHECETALVQLAKKAPEFPNLAEAELWRGRALAAQRKARAARQAFERVTSLDAGELAARARMGLGGLLEAEGRTDEALSEYLKVAVLYAHDEEVAEALFRAGSCLETLGNHEQALAQYKEVASEHAGARFARHAVERLRALESVVTSK